MHDFKAWLAKPGSTLTLIDHPQRHPKLGVIRRIARVNNTDFEFEDGTIAGFRSAQAWTFSGPYATLTLNASTTHGEPIIIRYIMDPKPDAHL